MSDMPERIWAEVSPNSGDEWWTAEPSDLGKATLTEYIRADVVAANAKSHEKEIAVWAENYAALERKLALAYHRAAEEADPWCGPPVKSNIVNAQSIAAQQIKARILALAPASATLEQTPIKP